MDKAVILAEGYFSKTDGKTAHGLVRYSKRYTVVGVIDSKLAGKDANEVLGEEPRGIRIVGNFEEALAANPDINTIIVGVATAGGKLPDGYREVLKRALRRGINVVSGLHEFLSDDLELTDIAKRSGSTITDVRKIFRDMRVFYTGSIKGVKCLKVVVLGTDSCVGKRTTAILLSESLTRMGIISVVVGTGQTAWMQGIEYGIVLDAMINDFITGGLESEVVRAYEEKRPDVIIVPAQGAIIHPVFPGGYEVISIVDPEVIILQHAPGRKHLDGFPEYTMPSIARYVNLIKFMTGKKISAITINDEGLDQKRLKEMSDEYERRFGIVTCSPFVDGVERVAQLIRSRIKVADLQKQKWT